MLYGDMPGKKREKRRSWTVICSCGRKYIYDRDNRQGHTTIKCNSCTVNERRFQRKRDAVAHKGGKCKRCGYDRSQAALVFHHKGSSGKLFGFSGNHARSWASLVKELDKCDLVCLNCHAEIHEGL